jgi:hypothetical protein
MFNIKYVSASLENSCVPACLAMILGKTLRQVIKDLYEHWVDEGNKLGMGDEVIDQYLAANGFAVQRICHEYEPHKLLIDKWPIKPFAPIHIVDVWSSNPAGMHAVVMNFEGKIYDPSNKKIKSIDEYQRVFAISGIWEVTTPISEVISLKVKTSNKT